MNALLHIGLNNALAASLLALLALAVGSRGRRPALTHALWLLVLLKLVTPPLVWISIPWPASETPTSIASAEPAPEPLTPRVEAESLAAMDTPLVPTVILVEKPVEVGPEESSTVEPVAKGVDPESASEPVTLVAVMWLGGSLVWLALASTRLFRFWRLLRYARPAAVALQERTRKLAAQLGLRRCPGVYLLPGRLAPMIWAAGCRARLLLPVGLAEQMGEDALDTLLLHELAHLRRRDHWVRGLELLVLALYWWHPFVWLARRELREAEEQCCDAWVVAALPGSGRTYATALVDALDFLSTPLVVPPLATGLGQVSDLKRRLTMIMRGTTPRALSWSGCLAVLTVAALLPLLPSWAQAQQPKPEPEDGKGKRVLIRTEEEGQPVRIRIGSDDGLNKDRAELERLEAELKQKLAEVEAARAKLKNAGRFTKVEKAPAGRNVQYFVQEGPGGQKMVWYVPVTVPGPVTHYRVADAGMDIEIIGLDDKPEIRKKVVDLLKKTLPEGRRVIILCGAGPQAARIHKESLRLELPRVKVNPIFGRELPPAGVPVQIRKPGTVESLQKQLEELRREVEKMRKEMKRSEPGKPEANNPNAEEIQRLKDQLKRTQVEAAKAREVAEQQHIRAAQAEIAARAEAQRALEQLKMAEKRLEEARRAREAKPGVDFVKPRKP